MFILLLAVLERVGGVCVCVCVCACVHTLHKPNPLKEITTIQRSQADLWNDFHNVFSFLISLLKDYEVINTSSNLAGKIATSIKKNLILVSLFSLIDSVHCHC
jgi:hypothetical protein